MKRTIISLIAITVILVSCTITSSSEDMEMLQKRYTTVYRVTDQSYVCADSTHVYHVKITMDGQIGSTVKIK
jgi:hypothetical protein